jgi:hypothetical protein
MQSLTLDSTVDNALTSSGAWTVDGTEHGSVAGLTFAGHRITGSGSDTLNASTPASGGSVLGIA